MACKHERIKRENCVISCLLCGEILPIDYLVGKERIAAQKAAETPVEAQKETPKRGGRRKVK